MSHFKRKLGEYSQRDSLTFKTIDGAIALATGNAVTKVLTLQPQPDNQKSLDHWYTSNRSFVEESLLRYGAVLFRGWGIHTYEKFGDFSLKTVNRSPLRYTYRSSPRTQLEQYIYTSTEYHSDRIIPLHNENSYTNRWPTHLVFGCIKSAEQGGETTLADSRWIYNALSDSTKQDLLQKGLMYVRNYGIVDLPWQEVFQTENKTEVADYCVENGLEFEWFEHERLQTRQRCQTELRHQDTGEIVWFNQAHLFHASAIDPNYVASLAGYKNTQYPRNCYHANGQEINMKHLDEVRSLYEKSAFPLKWAEGDVLLIDNLLVAHGRMPFLGERQIIVTMLDDKKLDDKN